ncbi:unnamed protein product [Lymnaea stagnalis]|uniref:TNFR-Cys domain-containing protein n=1 Tax=Lymnaea stagnalis TaxID=6523 RepID=A0AAV2IJD0_LYMST
MPCQEKFLESPSLILTSSCKPSLVEICIAMALSIAVLLATCCHMATLHHVQGELTCNKGQYLHHHYDTSPICLPCPEHTFISEDNHTFTDCGICKVAHSHLNQIIVKRCTPYSDAVVGCPSGYFRAEHMHTASAGECQKCADCSAEHLHEASPCNETHDTVCCAIPGMVAAITMTGQHICVFLQDKEIEIINNERIREGQNTLLASTEIPRRNRKTNSLSQILKRKFQS